MDRTATSAREAPVRAPAANPAARRPEGPTQADLSPQGMALAGLAQLMRHGPAAVAQQRRLQGLFGAAAQLKAGPGEEALQKKAAPDLAQRQGLEDEPVQRAAGPEEELLQRRSPGPGAAAGRTDLPARTNDTGLPDLLKSGVEALSGISLNGVKVHYNSAQPAQLNALAFAQGQDIHLAPGQEQHLPHEAWHVVQQAQGRVAPTRQMKGGVAINDDEDLEREADVMGARAAQRVAGPDASRADGGDARSTPVQMRARVAQLVDKEIAKVSRVGLNLIGVIDAGHVAADIGQPHLYNWPSDEANTYFNDASYGGMVNRALTWGLTAHEGTAGWYARQYSPADFDTLAVAANNAAGGLAAHAELDNDPNKTLIAVRTFRGSTGAGMAVQTRNDLIAIKVALTAQHAQLAAANLIANAAAAITEIRADPAEAHPNTLPTAKVTYNSGDTLYFKGRSGAVEDALVGSGASAAQALSALPLSAPAESVGVHGFSSAAATHAAANVGAAPAAGAISRADALSGWLVAAKTAALVSLTGTGDLHDSNVLAGASGKKHIIDAEFLLDPTAWSGYATATAANKIHNFSIDSMAPPWLKTYTHALPTLEKLSLGDDVAARFNALNIFQDATQELILAPIRVLIANNGLLRISPEPFITAFWLLRVTEYQGMTAPEQLHHLQVTWDYLDEVYPAEFHIDLANEAAVKTELGVNFDHGMVPLFHLGAGDGVLRLNKNIAMGQMRAGRRSNDFLTLTKQGLTLGHAHLLLSLRAAIVDA